MTWPVSMYSEGRIQSSPCAHGGIRLTPEAEPPHIKTGGGGVILHLDACVATRGMVVVAATRWLRDQCRCEACYNSSLDQRAPAFNAFSLPAALTVKSVATVDSGNVLEVGFSDGHTSRYEVAWLGERLLRPDLACNCGSLFPLTLWDGAVDPPKVSLADRDGNVTVEGLLDRIAAPLYTHGFVLVTDAVGAELGGRTTAEAVARATGNLLPSHWGDAQHLRANPTANNNAFTALEILPHVDLPYYAATAPFMFLHCVAADPTSPTSGVSTLTDGFAAAEALREEDPAAFDILTRTPFTFEHGGRRVTKTLIRVGEVVADGGLPRRRVEAVAVDRDFGRFDIQPGTEPEAVERAYAAFTKWWELLASKRFQLQYKMKPGEMFVIANHRCFHGRTAVESAQRHLVLCYADDEKVVHWLNSKIADARKAAPLADTDTRRHAIPHDAWVHVQKGDGPQTRELGPPRVARIGAEVPGGPCEVDLFALQRYRLGRVREQLRTAGVVGAVLFDPVNLRYSVGIRNMAVITLHMPMRCVWVPAAEDRKPTLFEFGGCEHLSNGWEEFVKVESAMSWFYFENGTRVNEKASRFAARIAQIIQEETGEAPGGAGKGTMRVGFDRCDPPGPAAFAALGMEVVDAGEPLEKARVIKSKDEIMLMRDSVAACERAMAEMRLATRPGATEQDIWSVLHAENIRDGGEWIETRLLTSGPRTNPWYQECSDRVVQAGELVAFDTDLVGKHGMTVDISRTFFCAGGAVQPTKEQRRLYQLAREQMEHNIRLLRPGATFKEIAEKEWEIPAEFHAQRYTTVLHGVGLVDEYPIVYHLADFVEHGYDGVVEPGMVLSVEAYIGAPGGSEGVKLEDMVLITADGIERMSVFPFEHALMHPRVV